MREMDFTALVRKTMLPVSARHHGTGVEDWGAQFKCAYSTFPIFPFTAQNREQAA